jgi:hypothetical protein
MNKLNKYKELVFLANDYLAGKEISITMDGKSFLIEKIERYYDLGYITAKQAAILDRKADLKTFC